MHLHLQTTYQAAQSVAPSIEEHFARQLASAQELGAEVLAPAPPQHIIEAFIDTAFWASLRREEGQSPKISIAFLPPDKAGQPLLFEDQLPFTPEALNKISPGVQRPGIHLGVWTVLGELRVWGTTRLVPPYCFIVDVPEPGLLVVKHRREDGFGKFANVAVLKGDQVKLVDESTASLPDCPELLTNLLRLSSPAAAGAPMNVLIQMAVSMRAHGRGGILLVVPAGTSAWRESIVHPITYSLQPAFCGLADLMKQDEEEKKRSRWRESLRLEVDSIAGLTAIDGATLLSEEYELLAFGIKIGRRIGSDPVRSLLFTEPVVGSKPAVIHPSQHGGTRHLSAAQFVHDQHDGMALVASQDGSFTIYAWSPCEGMVQAHRIDTLLL
ncbi:putative sensor domain DACNV-containing protein [Pontibacter flavimaris]|uniref:Probable sensor domain-containing protein n=1 Tax=Pontibacter flavimaris TaxID=1797110 RepID=A0A1Q5PDW3_9BACT|nr:hypothetical protein [Pontibacter flavimaris]OKL40439.1 hypothetical protein A3841_19230 [Pontibacter flavimaris]